MINLLPKYSLLSTVHVSKNRGSNSMTCEVVITPITRVLT